MIFGREQRNRGAAPWEGTQPLTGQAIVDFFSPDTQGDIVHKNEALTLAPVLRASSLISGTIANANKIYTDKKGELIEAPEVDIINDPNPMFDPWLFWESAALSVIFHGNFYAVITRTRGGAQFLTPWDPSKVEPKVVTRGKGKKMRIVDVTYVLTLDGGEKVAVPKDEMFHVAGLGWDGLKGVSILEHGRRVFSNSMKTDQYAEMFFGNGSLMSGVLTTDKRLDETSAKALQNRWKQKVQGIKNAFDIVVLDSGTKFEPVTVKPADAQFVDARRFNVEEVARMFGIPPELLGEVNDGQTSGDPEMLGILFVQFTGKLWTGRFASACNRQLLTDVKIKFDIMDMIMSSERTSSSAAVMWRKANVQSVNELRVAQGLPRLDDPRADDPFEPIVEGGADEPGTNQGNIEQPTPGDVDPADQSPTDQNL